MRPLFILFVALVLSASGSIEPYNPSYGTSVSIIYRAPTGRIPAEVVVAPPAYPFEMRRAGIAGEVEFVLTVLDDGRVADIAVTKSTRPEFKLAVEGALANWNYQPRKDGVGDSPRPLKLVGKVRFGLVEE